jgi:(2Fe-2S) ferredoxin
MQHVFFCTNECGSDKLRTYMKAKAKELGLDRNRINSAGCLDRCELGQTYVIHPEGVWYKCETTADVDRVSIEQMKKGNHVNDLVLGANE